MSSPIFRCFVLLLAGQILPSLPAHADWRLDDGIFRSKGTFDWNAGTTGHVTLLAEDQGPGTRLLWYPGKAAFRAGSVYGTQWNEAQIGRYSVALGYSTVASGYASTAAGLYSSALGTGSTAIGYQTTAGPLATAFGNLSHALGAGSTAMGYSAFTTGAYSNALGYSPFAQGEFSTAIGRETIAGSYSSVAIGNRNVGGGTSKYDWIATDPLFEIGNGIPEQYFIDEGTGEDIFIDGTNSNALTVYKNGDMRSAGVIEAKGGIRVPPSGGLDMGPFAVGKNPATLEPARGLLYPDGN